MSISGLVITLSDDISADQTLSVLAADPRLFLGERFGRRLAVVADTPSFESDRDLWDQLRSTPGITNVDVTFVHLDAQPAQHGKPILDGLVEEHHAHG